SFDAVADAWIGMAAPTSPEELTVTETAPGVLKFTWKAVTTNVHGHEIAPEAISYTITAGGSANVIASNLTGTEAIINYPAEGQPQTITDFTIKAYTAAGQSAGGASTPIVVVGQPYTMPYTENFPGGSLTKGQTAQIIADPNHAPGCWGYYEQLVNDEIIPVKPDGGMAAFFPYDNGDCSVWRSAKIEIAADAVNPYLSFFYYTIPGANDRLEVDINGDTVSDFTIDGDTRSWHEVLIPLAEYKGTVIRIGLTGHCVDANNKICVDDIAVKDEPANDMAITRARIPQEMHQGRNHLCSVKVTNLGVEPSGSYTVSVTDGDTEVWSAQGSGLERGTELEYTFNISHETFDRPGTTYTVTLTCDGDENTDDNIKSTETSFSSLALPAPSEISVTDNGNAYVITWNEVTLENQPTRYITEGFEAYDEFVCDTAGEWSFIDGDGCNVLGIRDGYHSYPNMFSPMAFMVFNNHDGFFPTIGTSSFAPYEGGQCLMSASVDVINSSDRSNDDRLISPKLSGKAQTIEFYARSSGMVFPEDISVMASSTDRLASSFTKVETFKAIRNDWKRYEVELPEGTQYFAICNESYDQYMLFIDNISFEAAPVETTVTGYDVYTGNPDSNDWTKLNDTPVSDTTLAVTELDADKSLRVATHFANGCTSYSDPATIDLSGIDNVTVDTENAEAEYFDMRGVRLNDRPTAPGLYIMRRGTTATKITVK
ncbi:MAG: choice-of-anchor J domain-containing protein, partial [Muribaculaceae bacterium]|nr:choice-of-anchor J domain-containing protein [Muribaculaceae bacterium]